MKEFHMLENLPLLHDQVDTPALLIYKDKLDKNIQHMQDLAVSAGVALRPHLKTHKSVWIAKKQLATGAIGVTVAKLSEAERMAENGITNIMIANQITHPGKMSRLALLNNNIELIIGIDNPDQIDLLKPMFRNEHKPLNVSIEINSGFNRCGVVPDGSLYELADKINQSGYLQLAGLFTHAGQVYGAKSSGEVKRTGIHEGRVMENACNLLAQKNIKVKVVSVGSTPTVKYSAYNSVVNEIRPGNYVFYDNIQCHLHSCQPEDCALYVLATVISQPDPGQIVIDAGSKALGLDRAHATSLIPGYGRIVNLECVIERVSEEHGVILLDHSVKIPLGSPLLIIPNHACAVVNLYAKYHLIESDRLTEIITIDARGCSQ